MSQNDYTITGRNGPSERANPRPPARPRVFVSYAHESDDHRRAVLSLCVLLVSCGVDVHVDRWYLEVRRDWQVWATRQILDADFVLVVASEQCRQAGDGTGPVHGRLGLRSEMRLLRELYHADPDTWTRRVLPVILPGRGVHEIPLFLQPRTADHYVVTSFTPEGADDLLRILHGTPSCSPPTPHRLRLG
ncbi:SEFIR domain-containing protein [Thermopolyspora sp. NPDC052614]|uniref:SEFIR domain-containing protein n=1 Tax=Thermopolyspora sp. NPDC052614 TaxID=3155682 RepID=UPI00343FA5C2